MLGVTENYVHKKLFSPRAIRTENYAHKERCDFIKREESVLESVTKSEEKQESSKKKALEALRGMSENLMNVGIICCLFFLGFNFCVSILCSLDNYYLVFSFLDEI